jgi:hypothetical protein
LIITEQALTQLVRGFLWSRRWTSACSAPYGLRHRGLAVTVPPGNQRMVLAALLLNAARVVCIDELAESLWGTDVPPSGPVTVQNYLMRLRKALGDIGRDRINTCWVPKLCRAPDLQVLGRSARCADDVRGCPCDRA